MKINKPFIGALLLGLGIMLVTSPVLFNNIFKLPLFGNGLVGGFGAGLEVIGIVLINKHKGRTKCSQIQIE